MTNPETKVAPRGATNEPAEAEEADRERAVEQLLEHVEDPAPAPAPAPAARPAAPAPPALRAARIAAVTPDGALLTWRGLADPVAAALDDGVDPALVARAFEAGDAVLVEVDPEADAPVILGVVQRRLPDKVEITGQAVVINAEREVLLRAGRAALRLRDDGDVEVVGSRISTVSRGLFRIVGRVLRLN